MFILLQGLRRKLRQLLADPVLRRWMVGRVLGRQAGEPRYEAHCPPYATDLLPLKPEVPHCSLASLPDQAPTRPLKLPLPGQTLHLEVGDDETLFTREFEDTEVLLGLHRFAWLPWVGDSVDTAWVDRLWRTWCDARGAEDESWAWHPYTAAERAINILRFARRFGLPGDRTRTLEVLAAHTPAMAGRLEYFGDHHTGNHLSNNGRGLYLVGLQMGLPEATELGTRILLREAERILLPSGVLREGSSHYHLLLTRNYAECWLAALAHGRPESAKLEQVTRRMLAVIPALTLPGGMPLIGDISPDAAPAFFAGLLPGGDTTQGWTGLLDAAERHRLAGLDIPLSDPAALAADGWLRADMGDWSGLWHAAPEGWSQMPGHGHQDLGSFELHYGNQRIFLDPGRGAYGETGEAAYYRSGRAHNGLLMDGADPYPANKPYYDPTFRRRIGGAVPRLELSGDRVSLRHDGFGRLPGVGTITRSWQFEGRRMTLRDDISGRGRHQIVRSLHTLLPVRMVGEEVLLNGRFRLRADRKITLHQTRIWEAYGQSRPGHRIDVAHQGRLPCTVTLHLEVMD